MPARVILADCPWEYADRRETRKDNPSQKPKFGIGAEGNYSLGTMANLGIEGLGPLVRNCAADDAYLFLWVTCPLLQEGLDVMKAWGFTYGTVAFSWTKTYPKAGTPFAGPGRYTFSNIEFVIVGRRGKCWHPNTGWKPLQEIRVPHPRDDKGKIIHSRKPAILQETLVKWLGPHIGDGKFLELFSTEGNKENWTCLGYDVTGNDIAVDLRAYAKE